MVLKMNKITALNVFRRVVELGTFRAAADDLHFSQAAVSKNINELEEYLGIALINRTTRRMSMTEAGIDYYEKICHVLDELESADQSLMASSFTPKGRLRISLPMAYGLIKLHDLICSFKRNYPGITIEVMLNDSYVDLIESGIDVAIRGGSALHDSTMRSKQVFNVRRVLCASPDYLAGKNEMNHPEDLRHIECLAYSLSASPRKWFFAKGNDTVAVELEPASYSVNNGIALKQAALHGLGAVLLPEEYVLEELATGQLVEIIPEWKPENHSLYAVYPYHKEQSLKVRVFIDYISDALN